MSAMVANADVRATYYAGVGAPASTWVEVSRLVSDDLLLEVEVLAVRE